MKNRKIRTNSRSRQKFTSRKKKVNVGIKKSCFVASDGRVEAKETVIVPLDLADTSRSKSGFLRRSNR